MGATKQMQMEAKTSAGSTLPNKETTSDPTTSGPQVKCLRCDSFFSRGKIQPGLFRAWLNDYCEDCRGEVENGWKAEESKRIQEEKARAALDRQEREKRAKIEALGGEEPYEKFLLTNYRADLNNTHDWFNHAKAFPLEARNLFVYGPPGSGKTFLCTAIIRMMWNKGGTCRFLTAQQAASRILFNEMGRTRNIYDQEEAINRLASIDALFIDELNELDIKDKYINSLKQLVDARSRRRKRGLLIAANVDLKTVATLMGLPLADRLRDQTFDVFRIPEDTPSARALMKQEMRAPKQGS